MVLYLMDLKWKAASILLALGAPAQLSAAKGHQQFYQSLFFVLR